MNSIVDENLTFLKWSPLRPTADHHLMAKKLKHWLVNIFSLMMFFYNLYLSDKLVVESAFDGDSIAT